MLDDDRVLEDLKALDILQIAVDIGRDPNRQNVIHCTFHDEKTPSLKLYPAKGRFKCFGCGKTGSTIDLYASVGNGDFGQAVKEMKSRYLGMFEGQVSAPRRLARPVVVKEKSILAPAEQFSPIYSALRDFCLQYGTTETKLQARDYLKSRAFTVDIIRQFGIFVIPDVKATSDFLASNYDRTQLEASGLFAPPTEKGKGGFMFFRHPIMIPYVSDGQIVNLQGRCIGKPVNGGWKYQYLRERTPSTMFNVDVLKTLAPSSKVYLTEGAFDTMAATQKGGSAVSINSATLFQPEWVTLFKNLNVCFLLDSDEAGQKAIQRLAPLFKAEKIDVSKTSLPANCKDVNEWLISGEPQGYPAFWD